jgi:hypothetical protein
MSIRQFNALLSRLPTFLPNVSLKSIKAEQYAGFIQNTPETILIYVDLFVQESIQCAILFVEFLHSLCEVYINNNSHVISTFFRDSFTFDINMTNDNDPDLKMTHDAPDMDHIQCPNFIQQQKRKLITATTDNIPPSILTLNLIFFVFGGSAFDHQNYSQNRLQFDQGLLLLQDSPQFGSEQSFISLDIQDLPSFSPETASIISSFLSQFRFKQFHDLFFYSQQHSKIDQKSEPWCSIL